MPQLITSILNGGIDPGISGTGARASYAMLSYNTSSSQGGYALFSDRFGNVLNYGDAGGYNSYGATDLVYIANGSAMNYTGMFPYSAATQNYPSSNTTTNYINSTNNSGEFGNTQIDIFSDGTWQLGYRNTGTSNCKHYLNSWAINSDHQDKRNVYLLANGLIRCVDRLYGGHNFAKPGTADYTVSSLNTAMQGTASYNASRKELTILSFTGGSGQFNVITFQNVDFNLYPSPNIALNRPEVVRVNSSVTMSTGWNVNNNESYYNLKCIVTNNGTVYVTVMFTSNSFSLYTFTRSGTSAVTGSYQSALSLSTSYGIEQNIHFGQRMITSRDGTSVCVFCPYYYYGSGVTAYMIDKINNNFTSYSYTDSNYGTQVVPFLDNGWAFIYAGNAYASNWGGGYVLVTYQRSSTSIVQTGSTTYFTKYTYPNTTNYPGYTQTVDFPLLTGNPYGYKLSR